MPELVAEPEPLPEPQPDLGLPEFAAEPMLEETVVIETPFETEPEENERVETAPEESARHESVAAQVEPLPWARKNGGSHGAPPLDASPKSLEDSVKDMLRPMLKQWLDENMARVLTAALKEELGERGGIRQGD
jgi:cell pole-organizing protein PopZ